MPSLSLVKKRNATACSVAENGVRAESMPALRPSFRMTNNSVGLCIYLPALLFVTCVAAMNSEEGATGSFTAIKNQYAMVSEYAVLDLVKLVVNNIVLVCTSQ